ncbi:hypothetical protein FALBO_7194 [Fusarium albosuccineum]|uniref:Uncharacterized protein n=1 Tax=Fusarium albosuccineum TaxID=1237068 RepID=A0A8H4LD70_9HYPO|nr:hypothetical protein FALBO_7194 [Fusarium albosuccineum]
MGLAKRTRKNDTSPTERPDGTWGPISSSVSRSKKRASQAQERGPSPPSETTPGMARPPWNHEAKTRRGKTRRKEEREERMGMGPAQDMADEGAGWARLSESNRQSLVDSPLPFLFPSPIRPPPQARNPDETDLTPRISPSDRALAVEEKKGRRRVRRRHEAGAGPSEAEG